MSAAAAKRAMALVGVRFRPNGRDPATGLDCAGLAGAAHGIVVAARFAMRGGSAARVAAEIARHGFGEVAVAAPGDVVVMTTGPAQFHLGVQVANGIVHADARIGRVVLVPGPPPWPVIGRWRPSTRVFDELSPCSG